MRWILILLAFTVPASAALNPPPQNRGYGGQDGVPAIVLQVVGDSIALGIGRKLCASIKTNRLNVICRIRAIERIPSQRVISMVDRRADIVVISMCANDRMREVCARNITTVRQQRIKPEAHVLWIAPSKPTWAGGLIERAAKGFADPAMTYAPGRDGVHPRDYEMAAVDALLQVCGFGIC